MTENNRVDLDDFFSLTGADSTRIIHQIVFVALANQDGEATEHSLLVSGHFDQPHLFKSAVDGGAATTDYHTIPVLEIQPLSRERRTFNDVRWLAVLDSSLVVFGSVTTARMELDRYLAHSRPEGSLLDGLGHLRSNDQTWCRLSSSPRGPRWLLGSHRIQNVLSRLSLELAQFAKSGNEVEFGFHYGRRVEFDYAVTFASIASGRAAADSFRNSLVEPVRGSSLTSDLNMATDTKSLHGTVEISISKFKAWLAEIKRERLSAD